MFILSKNIAGILLIFHISKSKLITGTYSMHFLMHAN